MAVSGEETSLKQILQGMQGEDIELLQGTVTSASPLTVQIVNDDKLILSERVLVVPQHLSSFTVGCTISVGNGSLNAPGIDSFTLTNGTLTINNSLAVGDKVHVLSLNKGKKYLIVDRVVS